MQPVEALLEVAAFPDDSICAMTFNFWHRLSCDLTSSFSPASSLQQPNGSHQVVLLDPRDIAVFVAWLPRCGSITLIQEFWWLGQPVRVQVQLHLTPI